jgi:hypothetical protein
MVKFQTRSNNLEILMRHYQCCGSVTFWYGSGSPTSDKRIRIRLHIRLRIMLFSSVTFKMELKNVSFSVFFAHYFLKLHLYHFSRIKIHKEVTKQ